ncbi:restriction endonuclease subunit S [Streptomyces prasinus]
MTIIPWLGPVRYPVVAAKHAFEITLGKMFQASPSSSSDVEVPYFKSVSVQWYGVQGNREIRMWATPTERHSLAVRTGDLLICEGGDVGRSAIYDGPDGFIFEKSVHRVRPIGGSDTRYLWYVLQALHSSDWLDVLCNKATIRHLTGEKLGALEVPLPPQEDQRRIAKFLDTETLRIDRLIELRSRTLTLFAEQYASRIDVTVRGGAFPAQKRLAEYTPLGLVPAGWRHGRLRSVDCEVQTGPFGSQLHAEDYVENAWPVVNPANITPAGLIADNQVTVSSEVRARLNRHTLKTGDVVFGRRGELGRAGIVTKHEEGWLCGTGSLRVRFREGSFHPDYLRRYLSIPAVRHYFRLQAIGSTMPNLNSGILLNLPLLLPTLSEQAEIATQCNEIEHKAAQQRLLVERQVQLLRERRRALITAAVTGQFDVSTASGRNVTEGVAI